MSSLRPAERLYRWLLRLVPTRLGPGVREEMFGVFRAELAERRGKGLPCLLGFTAAIVADLAVVVFRERWARRAVPLYLTPLDVGSPGGRGRRQTMEHWLLDLKTGVRTLRRSPGYTLTSIVILGLAIGANATIFSLIHTLFLEAPPHVEAPEQLVRVHRTSSFGDSGALSYPDFADLRDRARTLSGLAAYDPDGLSLTVTRGAEREPMFGWLVSADYFEVLGVRPAAGRWFAADEDVVDAPAAVAVISHRTWQRLFGGRSDAIGSSLALNGHPFTVIGVAPAGFRGVSPIESAPDVWVPLTNQPLLAPVGGEFALKRVPGSLWVWLWCVGRVAPNATAEQAGAELELIGEQLAEEYPEWNENVGVRATAGVGLHPGTRGGMLTIARILAAVVAVVLLVACANIAILLLARAAVRRREAGVRLAIGASRARLVRLMLTESLLLALAGGVVGLLLALSSARLAATLLPVTLSVDASPSGAVIAFAFACSVAAALLFTALPATQAAGRRVSTMLRSGAAARGGRLQTGLVAMQVALSVTLVVSGLLLVRSLRNARAVDLGFEVEGRSVITVDLRNHGYDDERGIAYTLDALDRLHAVPGVRTASAARMMPFAGGWTGSILPEGRPLTEGSEVDSGFNAVTPGYFETMGIPIVAGRDLSRRDDAVAEPVAVVNEEFVRRFFPARDPVGLHLYRDPGEPAVTVVGVARDARYYELDEEPQPMVYLAELQRFQPRLRFIVHSPVVGGASERALREALASVDPEVALGRTVTFEELVGNELGRYRTAATLVGLFALLALVLASVGLYGALSYLVIQRTREIGIRVAIGAAPGSVAGAVLRRGILVAGSGLLVGLLGALWATRFVESLLFGLARFDSAAFLMAPAGLLLVAVVASWLPARRAMGIDPMRAIRLE